MKGRYLHQARKYRLTPYIQKLIDNLDVFSVENECVDELSKYAGYVPRELLSDYVCGCGFVNDVLQNQKTSPRLIKALM